MPTEPTSSAGARAEVAHIDLLLGAQIAVAWAGERGDNARLGWWRTDLMSEYGGEDLFKRLLPHTWDWGHCLTVSCDLAGKPIDLSPAG